MRPRSDGNNPMEGEDMARICKIEVFSAGCPVCAAAVAEIRSLACPACEVSVLDMRDDRIAERAEHLCVRALPAVAIDGVLADCCTGRGIDVDALRAAGLGQPFA